ncbi:DUF397 domain-containing protein [Actinoallomurus purpureus]
MSTRIHRIDNAEWRKSTHSQPQGSECVEVSVLAPVDSQRADVISK